MHRGLAMNNNIKYLVMDVDGTLTDGKIYMGDSGELCKAFNIKDGYGIHDILIPNNIEPVIMTGRRSVIVQKRCEELGITKVYQGITDKLETIKEITSKLNEVAYIGDDLNDLPCMKAIKSSGGVVGCPKDAVKNVKDIADFISKYKGGQGAVREFIEWLIDQGEK